ncbi:MAG: ArsA family ATPase [Pseudomonadota bacterium]
MIANVQNIFFKKGSRLTFVGGKGGVGKTTTAAALAMSLAKKAEEHQIMLISTDPAHSLSDSFGQQIGNKSTQIEGTTNLYARELDAAILLDHFKREHAEEIKLLADRGTYFDSEDIQSFFDLSFPGIDEVMAILEMAKLLQNKKIKHLIVDTAPTGHTLSLLRLPKILDSWLNLFDLMQEKHRIMQRHFAKQIKKDSVDNFLDNMRSDLKHVRQMLCDRNMTEFIVVMLPESLSLLETKRLISSLDKQHVPFSHIVVNGIQEDGNCQVCSILRDRQNEIISKLQKDFSSTEIIQVPLALHSIQGSAGLEWFSAYLEGKGIKKELKEEKGKAISRKVAITCKSVPLKLLSSGNPKLLIVGGKGGVGKTTIASITALRISSAEPDKKFLLFSIDPAHSLSDCLGQQTGNKIIPIQNSNLYALELDAYKLLERFKREYRETVDNLFDSFFKSSSSESGMDLGYDRKLINDLMEMSPPGLEELMALYQVIDYLREESDQKFDTIIFDTAPTGHLFRFLELPHLIREWLNAIFQLLIKYKQTMSLGAVAGKMVKLSKDIRAILEIFADKEKTRFVVVATLEPMVIAETKRFIEHLGKLHIPLTLTVANMFRENMDCDLCRSKNSEQQRMLKELERLSPKKTMTIPFISEGVGGVEKLKELGKMIYN